MEGAVPTLTSLPPEVMVLICQYLTVKDKLCLKLVCKTTHSLLDDGVFWSEIRLDNNKIELLHDSFLEAVFKTFSRNLRQLELPDGIPCTRRYVRKLSKCKNIEKIRWASKLYSHCALPASPTHLHLNISYLHQCSTHLLSSVYENLTHLVLDEDGMIAAYADLLQWSKGAYRPPCVAINLNVSDSNYLHVAEEVEHARVELEPTSVPACYSIYNHSTSKPSGFHEMPRANISVRALSKIYAKVEGPDTYPLLVVDTAVNPDIFQSSATYTFGYVCDIRSPDDIDDTYAIVPYPSAVCADDLQYLDLSGMPFLECSFINIVLSQLMNLVELNLSHASLSESLVACLYMLPSFCPRLKGLNIGRVGDHNGSRQHLWHILSQMSCLEYLVISYCLLLPVQEGLILNDTINSRADVEAIYTAVSKVTSLRALQITSCEECLEPSFQKSLNVLQTISHLKTLQYLCILMEGNMGQDGLEHLLENLPNLDTLRIETHSFLDLPSRPKLYAKLKNLAVMTKCAISKETVAALTLNGNNHQLKIIGLIVYSLPKNGIFDILDGCPNLRTCIVCCRQTKPHSICKAEALVRSRQLTYFDYRITRHNSFRFGHVFANSDLDCLN